MKKLFESIIAIGQNRKRWVWTVCFSSVIQVHAALAPKDFADPLESLTKSVVPLNLTESFLELDATAAVQSYYDELLADGKADAANRVRCLQELYAGNNAGALQALEILSTKDVWSTSRVNYLTGLTARQMGFVETRSDHFAVRVSSEDAFLADIALRALENARTKFGELLGSLSETPVVIEIYPTVESFLFATTLPSDAVARLERMSATKFGRVMVLSPRATTFGYRWVDAIVREYARKNIQRLSGNLSPPWLTEGSAHYLEILWHGAEEFALPLAEQTLLRAALSTETVVSTGTEEAPVGTIASGGSLIPFAEMESGFLSLSEAKRVSLAAAESTDAVAFLVDEQGADKWRSLLNAFRSFTRKEAFVSALGMTEEEFESAWREFLSEEDFPPPTGALPPTLVFKPAEDLSLPMVSEVRDTLRSGDRLREQNKTMAAVTAYKKALDMEPDNGVALTRLAQAYLLAGRTNAVFPLLQRAQEKNPSYVPSFVLMADLYFDEGRYEEAQAVLQQALEIHPFHPKIHEILGLIAVDVGNFTEARRLLTLSLRLDPDNEAAHEALRHMPKRR